MFQRPLRIDDVALALAGPPVFPTAERLILGAERGAPTPAAVVVLLGLSPEPEALVIARSDAMPDHAGELGFPGGKPEPGGESLESAAYRELAEELGVARERLTEVGTLTPIPVVTGKYLIHPFVAVLPDLAGIRSVSPEIETVFRVPLAPWLSGRARPGGVRTEWHGQPFVLPHFAIAGRVLYGASACIFYELLARLARVLGSSLAEPEVVERPPWGDRYGA